MKAAKQNRSKRNRADRKNGIRENKKRALFAAGAAVLLLGAGAAAVWMMNRDDEGTVVYKETTVQHGSLTVGIEDSGSVEIGTVEQDFDLDVSEYTGGNSRNSGGGFMGMRPGGQPEQYRQETHCGGSLCICRTADRQGGSAL